MNFTNRRSVELQAFCDELLAKYSVPEPIFVTRPSMPPLEKFQDKIKDIWERRWLTNNGPMHEGLERALAERLGVEHLSLFCNGTIALMVMLQALRINSGEVITTPFTFPATPHVLYWNRVRPVFCDVEPNTFNLDPERIERLINPETKAIYPVHVYGNPCNVERIQEIADRHGLFVIYDASHAFGVNYKQQSILNWGNMSTLSFHATKLYSTIEGGALISGTATEKKRVDFFKNFGIANEEEVIGPGINGKMNELQAAYGLLMLDEVDAEIESRKVIVQTYRRELAGIPGIAFFDDLPNVEHNYAYFPIFIDAKRYPADRDALYTMLKKFNINTRKYFYPLCSHYPCYAGQPSTHPDELPVAEKVAREVLCLPLYGTLDLAVVGNICSIIREIAEWKNAFQRVPSSVE